MPTAAPLRPGPADGLALLPCAEWQRFVSEEQRDQDRDRLQTELTTTHRLAHGAPGTAGSSSPGAAGSALPL